MITIIGASGYIGHSLFDRFKDDHFKINGTYSQHPLPGLFHLDLTENDLLARLQLRVSGSEDSYMVIAAAAHARPDASKIHWDESYNINVVKIREILDYCFMKKIIPIYLSTDNVFDGFKGGYGEADSKNPLNSYGAIKHEVEEYIFRSRKPNVILRLGKVFGINFHDGTFFTSMLKEMKEKEEIHCATDQVFTPCYIEDLYLAIKNIIEEKYLGVFHLASLKRLNRYEVALAIKNKFNMVNIPIIPCTIDSLGLLEPRPKLIDLNINKWKQLTGFKEKSLDFYLSLIH